MTYNKNYIYGMMQVNWSIRHITRAFGVSSVIARLYLQPCNAPEDVNEILQALENLKLCGE